jgi:antitoxin component YwqK of YwqJK toxin-antitoxin module
MQRVNFDDLLLDYYEDIYLYKDEPFTGIAYYIEPDYPEGQIQGETEFISGNKEGLEREWYPDGQIKEETYFLPDDVFSKEWNEDGKLVLEEHSWGGTVGSRKRWDDEGNLIEDYEISPEDSSYKHVEFLRNRKRESQLQESSNDDS